MVTDVVLVWIPMSGPDRVRRFISSLALTGLPDRGQILPNLTPTGTVPKFLHGSLQFFIFQKKENSVQTVFMFVTYNKKIYCFKRMELP